ncbi:tRNA pseudouridine(38-40) synthase TruA [Pelagicoccus albus]|nr:tRNA pseudouridine(38-40) synthase TruA [Pelagicoccus albus]
MRWKCTCAYDGREYAGWQKQNGQISVQQVVEEVMATFFKEPVGIQGSGRTDAGVHALEQVFHFDQDWKHGGEKMVKAFAALLPKSIQVSSVVEVEDDFHARFSAISKRYFYQIKLGDADPFEDPFCWSIPGPIDFNLLNAALELFVGEKDFAAFASSRGNGLEYETTVRTIQEAKLRQDSSFIRLSFQADGFMYKMVRSLVGTAVNVGAGRLSLEQLEKVFETKQRIPLVQAAPAKGLFLEKVFY